MFIKSLFEIAFYGSLVVARKVGSTLEDNLSFSKNKTQKESTPSKSNKKEATQNQEVIQKDKGSIQEIKNKLEEPKKITPKEEAKIMNYPLKTKRELYEVAQELDLEGRSTMSKTQLLKALQEHAKK